MKRMAKCLSIYINSSMKCGRTFTERLYNTVYFNIREMLDFFDIPSVKLAKKCGVSKYLMKKYVEEGKMPADVYDMMREKYPDLFPEY